MDSIQEIEFNWERIKNKATAKRDHLVNNTPHITKRQVNTVAAADPAPQIGRTSTTDITIDPYSSIGNKANPIQATGTQPIDTHDVDTHNPELLAPASPESNSTLPMTSSQSEGPERNAVELLKGIREGNVHGKTLTQDERRLVVKSMKDMGQTQDAIAELLKISRRTVVNDYKILRHEQALAIQATDTMDMAGEVYAVAKTCIRRALQAGHFKTVSVIMRDMVEVLQSLGVVYRAPKTSMQASLYGTLPGVNTGYQKYMDTIGEDKNKVVEVLDCMFNAIDSCSNRDL